MFLKHVRGFAAALLVVATTSGCSYLFGPKPDDAKPFVKKSDDACVKDVPANVKAWLKDGKADIGRSVDCAVGAINDFSRHVAGKTKNVYTATEVKEFISEYLVSPDSPNAGDVSSMTDNILRVKQVILGGTSDLITRDELDRVKSILLRAKPLLTNLSPNIQTLLMNSPTATATDVDSAATNLQQILDLLAQEFERAEPGRPETSFKELLVSAHKLGLRNDEVSQWLPLVESMKVLILSGDPDVLRTREWAPMIRTIAEGWGLALRAKYNLAGNPEWLGRDFPMTEKAVRSVVTLLDRAVQSHNGAIPNDQFESLIDELNAKNMMPSVKGHVARAETLKSLLPAFFGKLLYGRWHADYDRQSQRFGPAQLAVVRSLVDDWIAGQTLINQSFNGQKKMAVNSFGQSLAKGVVLRKSFADDLTYQLGLRAQKQLLQFISKGRPLVHDDQGRLLVVSRKELPVIAKSDLDFTNEVRIAVGAVLTGWTADPLAAQGLVGLTSDEVQQVYLDLRELGHDFNFIDVRSNQAGTRTFMENSIFMSSSDGNSFMGLQEGVEWFNFVTSGSGIADKLYAEMAATCGTSKIDVLGNQKLEPTCFRREFLKKWTEYLPNLPHLVSWARQDGSGQRAAEMLTALENAGRNRGASNELVDSSEFRSMIPIAHYLESMLARHDVNQNGVLDNDEIWGAFPLLAPFIKKMGQGKADSEDMQKAILSYILEFGTVPSTDIAGMLKLGGWYLVNGWFSQSADRTKVLQVIGAFPASNKAARVNNITEFYDANSANLRALLSARERTTALKITDLFQCLPQAAPILSEDFALNIDNLAPAGKSIGADAFVARVKILIGPDGAHSDSRLETYCLPF